MGAIEKMHDQRIGNVFHESFSLSRPAVAKVLEIASIAKGKVTFETIREGSSLGKNYVKAMPQYAVGCGFLAKGSYRLTPLGTIVRQKDPDLSQLQTQWIMHYHLSSPRGPGPEFWSKLAKNYLIPGREFDKEELVEYLSRSIVSSSGKPLVKRTVRTLATVFLGTYMKEEGIGKLNLIERQGERFQVLQPEPPTTRVVGYCLAHYWRNRWEQLGSVFLDDLYESGGFASLLFMNRYQLNKSLREMQRHGLLELYQLAPPHTIERRWRTEIDFVDGLYD